MNWYYEKEGICQGPLTEEEMMARMARREMSSDSLVWNGQMDSWSTVAETKPEWLLLETDPPPGTQTADETPSPQRPSTAPLKPMREAPAKGAAPAPSRLKPQAPVGGDEAKPGFFKRLFGGKK